MTLPIFKTLSQLLSATRGKQLWYDEYYSIVRHLLSHEDALGSLSVGSPPGVFAPYDTRFYVTQAGFAGNAYTAALSPVATGEAIPTGYGIVFTPDDGNTGAATLDVGSTDGAVAVKKYSGGTKQHLAAGDLVAGVPVRLVFDGTDWMATDVPQVIRANTTITVDSSGADFTTVGAALTSLAVFRIAAGVTVTIDVAAGTFAESEITCAHPQGRQIQIRGDSAATTTLSFSADAENGFVADGPYCLDIDGVTILSTSTSKDAVTARNGGKLELGSDVVIDGWGDGIVAENGGLVKCGWGLSIVDTSVSGIKCRDGSYVDADGVQITQDSVNGGKGIEVERMAGVAFNNGVVSGASRTGVCIALREHSFVYGNQVDLDDGSNGVYCQIHSLFYGYGANINSASSHAVVITDHSCGRLDGATVTNSGGWGLLVQNMSFGRAGSGYTTSGHSTGNYSPAGGSDGNNNSRVIT
jgi:hypothetical protein